MSPLPLLGSGFQRLMSLFSGFPNCPRPQLPASHFSRLGLSTDSVNNKSKSESKLCYDQRSVCLSWYQAPSWAKDQIFVTVRQLRVYWGGVSSLTSGRVCSLQLLLVLVSAVPHIYIPRNRVAQLYSQALGSFSSLVTSRRAASPLYVAPAWTLQ
jgi:hypothetical protein